jgi:hypothetical protein
VLAITAKNLASLAIVCCVGSVGTTFLTAILDMSSFAFVTLHDELTLKIPIRREEGVSGSL